MIYGLLLILIILTKVFSVISYCMLIYHIHNLIKLFKNRSRCSRYKRKLSFNKMSYDMTILKNMVRNLIVYLSSELAKRISQVIRK